MTVNYGAFVASLASNKYHTEVISPRQVIAVLSSLVGLGPVVDDTKRGLFYGKRKEADQKEAEAFMANFDPGALPNVRHIPSHYQDVFHGILGMASELAEIITILIPQMNSGLGDKLADFDTANLIEELGDFRWYYQLVLNSIGSNDEHVVSVNVKKLQARFPEGKFSQERVVNRDLDAERKILEDGADTMLVGSNVLPSTINIEGQDKQLGELVRRAFERSGLTVEAWNNLQEEYREVILCRELSNWRRLAFFENPPPSSASA